MYWNKGNSYMQRKLDDIKTLVSEHKPHIFGLAEANVLPGHDQSELQIPDYSLHLASSLSDPSPSPARVAVYTHKSITVKRRPDLEEEGIQLVSLEAGQPGKKKSLYLVAYRQWQLPGQQDRSSGTVAAQAERWDRLLGRWEAALMEGKEVITVMDTNLDALTWRQEAHTLPCQLPRPCLHERPQQVVPSHHHVDGHVRPCPAQVQQVFQDIAMQGGIHQEENL